LAAAVETPADDHPSPANCARGEIARHERHGIGKTRDSDRDGRNSQAPIPGLTIIVSAPAQDPAGSANSTGVKIASSDADGVGQSRDDDRYGG
jgi:hypothetical protein